MSNVQVCADNCERIESENSKDFFFQTQKINFNELHAHDLRLEVLNHQYVQAKYSDFELDVMFIKKVSFLSFTVY